VRSDLAVGIVEAGYKDLHKFSTPFAKAKFL